MQRVNESFPNLTKYFCIKHFSNIPKSKKSYTPKKKIKKNLVIIIYDKQFNIKDKRIAIGSISTNNQSLYIFFSFFLLPNCEEKKNLTMSTTTHHHE